jgi:hypothetical protein
LKSETFTKQEVNDLISAITTMDLQVVQPLPTEDISTTTIYLVPKTTTETNNAYDEYIYVSNAWELIGSTEVDLTNYVQNTDYANSSTAGVIKIAGETQLYTTAGGLLYAYPLNYSTYTSRTDYAFINKGTLENVITGKNLYSNEYSTNEVVVGKWTNNKPIYRKVFSFTVDILQKNYTIPDLSINKVTNLTGTYEFGNEVHPLPYANTNTNYVQNLLYDYSTKTITIKSGTSVTLNGTATVIMEYIKTTD